MKPIQCLLSMRQPSHLNYINLCSIFIHSSIFRVYLPQGNFRNLKKTWSQIPWNQLTAFDSPRLGEFEVNHDHWICFLTKWELVWTSGVWSGWHRPGRTRGTVTQSPSDAGKVKSWGRNSPPATQTSYKLMERILIQPLGTWDFNWVFGKSCLRVFYTIVSTRQLPLDLSSNVTLIFRIS